MYFAGLSSLSSKVWETSCCFQTVKAAASPSHWPSLSMRTVSLGAGRCCRCLCFSSGKYVCMGLIVDVSLLHSKWWGAVLHLTVALRIKTAPMTLILICRQFSVQEVGSGRGLFSTGLWKSPFQWWGSEHLVKESNLCSNNACELDVYCQKPAAWGRYENSIVSTIEQLTVGF